MKATHAHAKAGAAGFTSAAGWSKIRALASTMLLLASFMAGNLAPQDLQIQTVVATIADVAAENAAAPEPERVSGDALADLYIRRACGTGQSPKAIVLGLAYALEPTGLMAAGPLGSTSFKDVETAEQRRQRLAVMGRPTLRGREDWLAHFIVSAGLSVALSAAAAELAGIQKECADAAGKEQGSGSGFSFTDLNADFAGIAFAAWLTGGDAKAAVARASASFRGEEFLPDPAGLPDGLTWTAFLAAWGGLADPRFQLECERLRRCASASAGTVPRAPGDQ